MKNILIVFMLITLIYANEQKVTPEQLATGIINEMSKTAPIQLNKYTMIVSAVKVDKELIIGFKTTLQFNQKMMNEKKEIFHNEWCNEKFLIDNILRHGYSFTSFYVGNNNKKLGEINTKLSDCINQGITK